MEQSGVDPAALMAASPDPVIVLDDGARVLYVNPAMEELVGADGRDYIGSDCLDFVHPDDVTHVITSLESVQHRDGKGTPIEIRVKDLAGRWHWLEVIGRDCRHVPGIGGIFCTLRDLTERRMWEVAGNDVVRFQQVVHHARAIVLCLDGDGSVMSVNSAFGRLLGFDPSHVIGSKLSGFAAESQRQLLDEAIASAGEGEAVAAEVEMRRAGDATTLPVRFEIVGLLDDPVVAAVVVTGQDVSELRDARQRLEHLATHDSMTGLPNREYLLDHLSEKLEAGRPFGVLYVDLDGFKDVNDTFGHHAGDELLVYAAQRLVRAVPETDLVARLGGDEFVVVAADMQGRREALTAASRLRAVLESPFELKVGTARIGASVGAVTAQPGDTVARLLARADRDMYAAKQGRAIIATPRVAAL